MTPRSVVLLGCCVSALGCHRTGSGAAAGADAAPAEVAVEAESLAPKATTLPARCQPTSVGYALDDGHGLEDLEIGDAVAGPGGFAIDVVHRAPAGRVAAVALLAPGATGLQVRDLGPILGDAPPPRVAWRGGDLLAVSYAVARRPEGRELTLFTISSAGEVRPTGTIPESRDDSLAFDLSSALAVWDEAKVGPAARGVIRIAEIGADGRPGVARDVSPPESDAEMPRLGGTAAAGGNALVFWIARKPEATLAADASEVTGEAPAYSWLEVVAVDPHGAPVGAARRLTSATGHVSNYDVAALPPQGTGKREVLVVARDDGEAVDGSGGALLRVRVREDGQEPPVAFATDGLGRGAPAFVDGTPPWLSWVAPREEGRLLSLDAAGVPTQLPSVEPALDEGRALVWLEPGKRILAAMPADGTAQLRVLACSP